MQLQIFISIKPLHRSAIISYDFLKPKLCYTFIDLMVADENENFGA